MTHALFPFSSTLFVLGVGPAPACWDGDAVLNSGSHHRAYRSSKVGLLTKFLWVVTTPLLFYEVLRWPFQDGGPVVEVGFWDCKRTQGKCGFSEQLGYASLKSWWPWHFKKPRYSPYLEDPRHRLHPQRGDAILSLAESCLIGWPPCCDPRHPTGRSSLPQSSRSGAGQVPTLSDQWHKHTWLPHTQGLPGPHAVGFVRFCATAFDHLVVGRFWHGSL